MQKLKDLFSRGQDEEQGNQQQQSQSQSLLQQLDEASTLTYKQRATGFGICVGVGLLASLLSLVSLWMLSWTKFAVLWGVGSLLSVGSTMFLMGPLKQLKSMFSSHRLLATCVYLGSTVLTLFLAFKTGNPGLCLIMLVIQIASLIWYSSTYIPGGQSVLKSMVVRNAT